MVKEWNLPTTCGKRNVKENVILEINIHKYKKKIEKDKNI